MRKSSGDNFGWFEEDAGYVKNVRLKERIRELQKSLRADHRRLKEVQRDSSQGKLVLYSIEQTELEIQRLQQEAIASAWT